MHFDMTEADTRPAFVCDDVEDLEVAEFHVVNTGGEPLIRLRQVRGALLQGCRPLGNVETFVSVEGCQSAGIALMNNDLRKARTAFTVADGINGEITE